MNKAVALVLVRGTPDLVVAMRRELPGVLVVDNGSVPPLDGPWFRIETNRYFSGGWNAALKHLAATMPEVRWAWLLNSDVSRVSEAMLDALVEMAGARGLVMVSPRVPSSPHGQMWSTLTRETDYIDMTAPLVDVQWYLRAGGLDERLPGWGADLDLCYRTRQDRKAIFGEAWVEHPRGTGTTSRRLNDAAMYRMVETRTYLVAKHGEAVRGFLPGYFAAPVAGQPADGPGGSGGRRRAAGEPSPPAPLPEGEGRQTPSPCPLPAGEGGRAGEPSPPAPLPEGEGRGGGGATPRAIVLGIGTGRCGLRRLAAVLNRQPDAQSSYEEVPWLPWERREDARQVLAARFARFRHNCKKGKGLLGDCASFYLPYLEDVIALEPRVRVACLRRPCEEVVASFCGWLDWNTPLPTNHWARQPAPGWHHDPRRTLIYPQYETQNREEGIRLYWEEYYRRVDELRGRWPEHIRVFDTCEALDTEAGLREVLSFAGVKPVVSCQLSVATRDGQRATDNGPQTTDDQSATPDPHSLPRQRPRRWVRRASGDPMDRRRCAVLVPFATSITPPCERALVELERRGYEVRRVGGYAAIDQGRNQMATDTLLDGYEETFWIDADVEFHPDAVDRLRSHRLPIVGGIYPQKGKRAIACHPLPGSPKIMFGKEGGLVEILYAGAGFLLVRREVYLTVQRQLGLETCNERFNSPMIPFFHPMVHRSEDGYWYLAEDWAFCQRARQCGYRVMADTAVRLWHVGSYSYGWEDAGKGPERFGTYVLNLGPEEKG